MTERAWQGTACSSRSRTWALATGGSGGGSGPSQRRAKRRTGAEGRSMAAGEGSGLIDIRARELTGGLTGGGAASSPLRSAADRRRRSTISEHRLQRGSRLGARGAGRDRRNQPTRVVVAAAWCDHSGVSSRWRCSAAPASSYVSEPAGSGGDRSCGRGARADDASAHDDDGTAPPPTTTVAAAPNDDRGASGVGRAPTAGSTGGGGGHRRLRRHRLVVDGERGTGSSARSDPPCVVVRVVGLSRSTGSSGGDRSIDALLGARTLVGPPHRCRLDSDRVDPRRPRAVAVTTCRLRRRSNIGRGRVGVERRAGRGHRVRRRRARRRRRCQCRSAARPWSRLERNITRYRPAPMRLVHRPRAVRMAQRFRRFRNPTFTFQLPLPWHLDAAIRRRHRHRGTALRREAPSGAPFVFSSSDAHGGGNRSATACGASPTGYAKESRSRRARPHADRSSAHERAAATLARASDLGPDGVQRRETDPRACSPTAAAHKPEYDDHEHDPPRRRMRARATPGRHQCRP